MTGQRPHFGVVCDHGIRGGQLDRVALLPWLADRNGWGAAQGVDEPAIGVWPMEGDRRGQDPKWLPVPGFTIGPDEPDLRRDAVEIRCPAQRCSRRAYRCDDAKLQTLLNLYATDEKFRSVFAVSADEKLIVTTLDALHWARDTAKTHYHLAV